MLEPQPDVKARYTVLFDMLRPLIEGKPSRCLPPLGAERPEKGVTKPVEDKDVPLKESGPAEL